MVHCAFQPMIHCVNVLCTTMVVVNDPAPYSAGTVGTIVEFTQTVAVKNSSYSKHTQAQDPKDIQLSLLNSTKANYASKHFHSIWSFT